MLINYPNPNPARTVTINFGFENKIWQRNKQTKPELRKANMGIGIFVFKKVVFGWKQIFGNENLNADIKNFTTTYYLSNCLIFFKLTSTVFPFWCGQEVLEARAQWYYHNVNGRPSILSSNACSHIQHIGISPSINWIKAVLWRFTTVQIDTFPILLSREADELLITLRVFMRSCRISNLLSLLLMLRREPSSERQSISKMSRLVDT